MEENLERHLKVQKYLANGYIQPYAVKLNSKGLLELKNRTVIAMDTDRKVLVIMYTADCTASITVEFHNMCLRDVDHYLGRFKAWRVDKQIGFNTEQNCYEKTLNTRQELTNLKESFKRLGTVIKLDRWNLV